MEQSIGEFNWVSGTEALLAGSLHPLLEQLGSPDGLALLNTASETLLCPKIDSVETLGLFLAAYREQLLFPLELPAIFRAHFLATHHQTRELIAFDRELAKAPIQRDFARASQRIGQAQLRRLGPLRDERVIQRYLDAVQHHQAHGWHTLVYGLTLAVYSLPIRQGLFNYARQTFAGFIRAGSGSLHLSKHECQHILDTQCLDLRAELETLLRAERQGSEK